MGSRDELATLLGWAHRNNTPFRPETFIGFVSQWSDEHRIALARELLAGTGRVVARDVGELSANFDDNTRDGWNACRAAMMGEGE
jgi:hypothetical protein